MRNNAGHGRARSQGHAGKLHWNWTATLFFLLRSSPNDRDLLGIFHSGTQAGCFPNIHYCTSKPHPTVGIPDEPQV